MTILAVDFGAVDFGAVDFGAVDFGAVDFGAVDFENALVEPLLRSIALFQYPFMQRALIGGLITGLTGGLLGSLTVVRQLSFFSDALGHSTMLGISIGIVCGLSPSVVVPFALLFA